MSKEMQKKVSEKGDIMFNYVPVEGTGNSEYFLDKYGSVARVYLEAPEKKTSWNQKTRQKKIIETHDGRTFTEDEYEHHYGVVLKERERKKAEGVRTMLVTDEDMKMKLIESFRRGLNDKERANFVGVGADTISEWKKRFPEFREVVEGLGTETSMLAKFNIHNAIKGGDLDTAKWYLERRSPDEFGKTPEVAIVQNTLNVDMKALKGMSEEDKDEALQKLLEK